MCLTTISVTISVIVLNIHEKSKFCCNRENRLPKFFRIYFLKRIAMCLRLENRSEKIIKQLFECTKRTEEVIKNVRGQKKSIYELVVDEIKCNNKHNKHTNIGKKVDSNYDNLLRSEYSNSQNTYVSNLIDQIDYLLFNYDREIILNDYFNKRNSVKKDKSPFKKTKITNKNNKTFTTISDSSDDEYVSKIKNMVCYLKKYNMETYLVYEWIMFGVVLDRLLFWIFFILTALSYFFTLYFIPLVYKTKNR